MKSSISTFALAAVVAIASLTAAHAQTQASRVSVPFVFECGGVSFAPGTYTLAKLDPNHITLKLGSDIRMLMVNNSNGPKNETRGYVAFRKYGNRYFLAEYHPANSANSMAIPTSKKERIVARDHALYQPEPGRVQLALNVGDWVR